MRSTIRCLFLAVAPMCLPVAATAQGDTVRIEIGAPELDARVYQPHRAHVRVYTDAGGKTPVLQWTNELVLGDSAGLRIMRWTTKGSRPDPRGGTVDYVLRQTYDARTLAPYGYSMSAADGAEVRLAIGNGRVRGTRRANASAPEENVDRPVSRLGYFSGASDLVPAAVGFRPGRVIVAPVWNPGMSTAEDRIFTIVGSDTVMVEGSRIGAWKVEERKAATDAPVSVWWLLDRSPYMVYGETVMPNGERRRMTEVEITAPAGIDAPNPEAVLRRIFEGMRTADSALIRAHFADGARFASVDTAAATGVRYQAIDGWLAAVARSRGQWEERAGAMTTLVDGDIAQVWAPYSFHVGGALRHCGVNAVALLRVRGAWRVTQWSDTRRPGAGCTEGGAP